MASTAKRVQPCVAWVSERAQPYTHGYNHGTGGGVVGVRTQGPLPPGLHCIASYRIISHQSSATPVPAKVILQPPMGTCFGGEGGAFARYSIRQWSMVAPEAVQIRRRPRPFTSWRQAPRQLPQHVHASPQASGVLREAHHSQQVRAALVTSNTPGPDTVWQCCGRHMAIRDPFTARRQHMPWGHATPPPPLNHALHHGSWCTWRHGWRCVKLLPSRGQLIAPRPQTPPTEGNGKKNDAQRIFRGVSQILF